MSDEFARRLRGYQRRIEALERLAGVRRSPGEHDAVHDVHNDARYRAVQAGVVDWRNTNQSIPHATVTTVVFDNTTWSRGGWSRTSGVYGKNSLLPGFWRVRAQAAFAGNSTGSRFLRVHRNGVMVSEVRTVPRPAGVILFQASTSPLAIVEGDTIEVAVFQDSGGALDLVGGQDHTWVELEFVGT